jgi:hypothetical protein
MEISVDALWKMSDMELLAAYSEARRRYVDKKFARDIQRARVAWLRARTFVATPGGVTERMNSVDASEELGRKGQEVREMTRDLDLLKIDVDVISIIVNMRGSSRSAEIKLEEPFAEGEDDHAGSRA